MPRDLGLLCALAFLGQDPGSRPTTRPARPIRVGDTVADALVPTDPPLPGHGPSKRFEFVAAEAGPVTLSLESFDFNAFLRVEDEAGEKVAEDDDGGVEWNARVVFDAKGGARYHVLLAAAKEGAGEFALSVARGEVPPLRGPALLDAGIVYRGTAAERALSRGDKKAAAAHRLAEGNKRSRRSQFAEAKVAYEASLALSREAGDRPGEAKALRNLGNAHHSRGEYRKASEIFEEHLALS